MMAQNVNDFHTTGGLFDSPTKAEMKEEHGATSKITEPQNVNPVSNLGDDPQQHCPEYSRACRYI